MAHWANNLILNGQHQEILVNYFEFEEFDDKGKRLYFNAWITDIPINDQNIEVPIAIGKKIKVTISSILTDMAKTI